MRLEVPSKPGRFITAASPDDAKYSFSFISGALYVPESLAIASLAREEADWTKVSKIAAETNVLKQRKDASRRRLMREIRYRLQELSRVELEFLCHAAPHDQRQLLFIAVCRRFRFIGEFVLEAVRPKALTLDLLLYPADFAGFCTRKSADLPRLEQLTPKSLVKIRQVIMRMMVQAGLLKATATPQILRPLPSRMLAKLIGKTDPADLRYLLLSDLDIRQLLNRDAKSR